MLERLSSIWEYKVLAIDNNPITIGKVVIALGIVVAGIIVVRIFNRTVGERLFGPRRDAANQGDRGGSPGTPVGSGWSSGPHLAVRFRRKAAAQRRGHRWRSWGVLVSGGSLGQRGWACRGGYHHE